MKCFKTWLCFMVLQGILGMIIVVVVGVPFQIFKLEAVLGPTTFSILKSLTHLIITLPLSYMIFKSVITKILIPSLRQIDNKDQ